MSNRDFLPEVDRIGGALLWNDILTKEKDWCESFVNSIEMRDPTSSVTSMHSTIITVGQVSDWYEERIREIEKYSGIISHALDLARLGIQRNIDVRKMQRLV